MNIKIRHSVKGDIQFLEALESGAFPDFQRNSRQSLLKSINSSFQQVWIAETKEKVPRPVGALVLYLYKKALRIYSIAVMPDLQGSGVGFQLLTFAIDLAGQRRYHRVLLEVYDQNDMLISWYRKWGFVPLYTIQDYYSAGKHALKMELKLHGNGNRKTSNLIVINKPHKWQFKDINATVISVNDYISNLHDFSSPGLRVFNLCSSYQYQSYGYYVSLLGMARDQRVIPSVATIRDFKNMNVIRSITTDIDNLIERSLVRLDATSFSLNVYFGQTYVRGFKKLAMKIYKIFEAPLFKVQFVKHKTWLIKEVNMLNLNNLPESEFVFINNFAREYFNKKRFTKSKTKNYKYDLAILVNPLEVTPPSCSRALSKFTQAAARKGIYTEFITKSDFNRINEFDALFIRETTSVSNYTYEISRLAYAEGLVVIDDPWSILKCSNKIYQNETFRQHRILTPETMVITKNRFSPEELAKLNYPCVIKQPDSAFSLGVSKVDSPEEAMQALTNLFKNSDLVICQEYLYSEYDWRIGVLDNAPLFACKYFMAKGHWQIYNWKAGSGEDLGEYETHAVEDVPAAVIKTAVKAASLFGDGFYGVDLKMVDNKVYVIEVNDNPNIDADIEDKVLQDGLYDSIISFIYNRIEVYKNLKKLVTA